MATNSISITAATIIDVWKQIVIDYPLTKCKTIHTFATSDDGKILQHNAALGKSYKDYLNGTFWSRDWIMSGANPNDIKKQYPVLALEIMNIKTKGDLMISPFQTCQKFYIVLADQVDCPNCPEECNRTVEQIDIDIQEMILNAFREFLTYRLYEVNDNEMVWLPLGKAEKLIQEGNLLRETRWAIETELINSNIEFKKWGKDYDKIRGIGFSFEICSCLPDKPNFEYKNASEYYQGVTQCSIC